MKENQISPKKIQKLLFLENALQNGWKIHKKKEYYIFSKKHNNEKKFFDEDFIYKFVGNNFKLNN